MNVELLEQTMRHIIDHPETHDQSIWISACGTTACFAGWACLLSGNHRDKYWPTYFDDVTTGFLHTQDLAPKLLDIDEDTAGELFDGSNTVDDLQRIVKQLINGQHTLEGDHA
jgi:hypothetical protein